MCETPFCKKCAANDCCRLPTLTSHAVVHAVPMLVGAQEFQGAFDMCDSSGDGNLSYDEYVTSEHRSPPLSKMASKIVI